jgi:hypothetical protein
MLAYAAIPLTCWLAAAITIPRTPLHGNEIEAVVYSRLLGQQHRLRHLAIIATAVALLALVLALPSHPMPWLGSSQAVQVYCTQSVVGESVCSTIGADGVVIQGT